MFSFKTAGGARFRCEADFVWGSVLNVNFHADDWRSIPFHLSVRRDEALVVVNRQDPKGWRREIRRPMRFDRVAVPVEVFFAAGRVRVSVNGVAIGSFDAYPRLDPTGRYGLRRGFPGLGRIAHVDVQGDVVWNSVLVDRAQHGAPPSDEIALSDALEVIRRGVGDDSPPLGVLRIMGQEAEVPAALKALPYLLPDGTHEHAMVAVLPGWLWSGGVQALDMVLEDAAGRGLGGLRLERPALVERIERLALSGGLEGDDRVAIQAIEHARHAGLAADLTPEAYHRLAHAAARFRLADFLAEGGEAPRAVSSPDLPPAPLPRRAEEASDRFTAALRADPGSDPLALLAAELAALDKPHDQGELVERLIECFALADRLEDLFRLRRDRAIPALDPPGAGDLYRRGLLLSLDYAEGRFGAIAATLWDLAPEGPAWLPTPALGWVLEQAARAAPGLDGTAPLDWQRTDMLKAGLDLVAARAQGYWGRSPCRRLIRAVLVILLNADSLPEDVRQKAIWTALRAYGLTPGFWDLVEAEIARGWTPPRQMVPVRAAFARIRAAFDAGTRDEAALSRDLDLFRQLGCPDLQRFRRELFGPLGLPGAEAARPLAPLVAGFDPDEALLRHLSFPGNADRLDAAGLEGVAEVIADSFSGMPRNPFARLQGRMLAEATALLEAPDEATMARFLRGAAAMMSGYSRFMGIALPLALLRGLCDRGRAAEGAPLVAQIAAALPDLAKDPATAAALFTAPAPRLALDALTRAHGTLPAVAALALALEPLLAPGPPPPREDRAADLSARAHPLQDTLLCLYTCQPYLETRVRAIRETWLPLLAKMGVPCLIFVGGGDGRRERDVVYLDAPDDYESLPKKTLAMARWVLDHTDFAHLVKVDDDCFVDPDAWFGDLAHRSTNYYGRSLTRRRGQMDRTWHQPKSRSRRARMELDKSPEPSTYADGGSGYALSRIALQALIEASERPEGRALIHVSFMEDKLVGDLLASARIAVDNTDYRVALLRRTRPGGPLVSLWDNGFLPFKGSGMKLAHLDGPEKMAEVLAGLSQPRPVQAKIWPSCQPVRQGWASNTLDLISPPEKLAEVNEAPVAVVSCLRNERFMLPRFLEHYRALGVRGFLMVDNGSDDGSFDYLAAQPDVALFSVDTPYSESQYGVAWQQALLANLRPNRWSLVADLDELLVLAADLSGDLPALVETPAFRGADAARLFMLDMYPEGPLSGADFRAEGPFAQAGFVDREPFLAVTGARGPYSDAPVWTSALRHRLIPGARSDLFVAQKIALLKYRPWMRLSAGLHFVADARLAPRDLIFAHFKYNAAFHAKARAEVARRQHFNNAEEYRKYLAVVSEGRDVIHDPAISVPWDQAPFVRRLLGLEAGRAQSRA